MGRKSCFSYFSIVAFIATLAAVVALPCDDAGAVVPEPTATWSCDTATGQWVHEGDLVLALGTNFSLSSSVFINGDLIMSGWKCVAANYTSMYSNYCVNRVTDGLNAYVTLRGNETIIIPSGQLTVNGSIWGSIIGWIDATSYIQTPPPSHQPLGVIPMLIQQLTDRGLNSTAPPVEDPTDPNRLDGFNPWINYMATDQFKAYWTRNCESVSALTLRVPLDEGAAWWVGLGVSQSSSTACHNDSTTTSASTSSTSGSASASSSSTTSSYSSSTTGSSTTGLLGVSPSRPPSPSSGSCTLSDSVCQRDCITIKPSVLPNPTKFPIATKLPEPKFYTIDFTFPCEGTAIATCCDFYDALPEDSASSWSVCSDASAADRAPSYDAKQGTCTIFMFAQAGASGIDETQFQAAQDALNSAIRCNSTCDISAKRGQSYSSVFSTAVRQIVPLALLLVIAVMLG